ncbi:MAG: zinc ribbon domain-containing protein [Thermoplasmataceae archaeon]
MPMYDSDEHELLKEESVLTKDDASIENGVLYLTDKKLIYEKKGSRKLLSAEASKIYLMVPIYNIENVSSAVPIVKLFTKKRIRVEYREASDLKSVEFSVRRPKTWMEEIKKWSSTARSNYADAIKKDDEEQFRRNLQLTKAKTPKNSINMIMEAQKRNAPGYVRNENQNDDIKDIAVSETNYPRNLLSPCPECSQPVEVDSKFCKNCGAKLK